MPLSFTQDYIPKKCHNWKDELFRWLQYEYRGDFTRSGAPWASVTVGIGRWDCNVYISESFGGVWGCILHNRQLHLIVSIYVTLWRHYPYGYENNRRRRGWAPIWVELCTWVPYYQLMKSFTQMRSIEIHQSLFCFSQWLIVNCHGLTSSFLFSLSLFPAANCMSRCTTRYYYTTRMCRDLSLTGPLVRNMWGSISVSKENCYRK